MDHRIKHSACAALAVCLLAGSSVTAAPIENRVTAIRAAGQGQPVIAKIDEQGAIHLLVDSSRGPLYVTSDDNGHSFNEPIAVVDEESRTDALEYSAWDMALGSAGHVHVAMGSNAWKLKRPKEEWGFYYARLDPGAEAFTPVRNINRTPSEGYSLAADDTGRVTACWLSDRLYVNVSVDNGATFSPNKELDPDLNPCNCCTTSAAYGADKRLAILYREETNNQRDMFLVLWDQQTHETSRRRISSTLWRLDTCPMSYYSVSRQQDGYLAVWPTKGQVYFSRLDGQGTPQPPAEIQTPGTTGTRTGMLALTAPDGSTLVAWKNEGQLGWQLYDPRGAESGQPGSAASPGKGVAGVVTAEGQFILFR